MSEWEEKLPPIMRERLAKISDISTEEKERMKAAEQINSVLSEFYQGKLDSDGWWKRLKVYKDEGKSFLLKEAQIQLIQSLNLVITGEELKKRKEGILAVETLKDHPGTSTLEQTLNSINTLQAKYKKEMQQRYDYFKTEIERNPRLRMQQVKQGKTTMVMQLSVDEAIKIRPEWKNFLAEHESRYGKEFDKVIETLKRQVK